MLLQPPQWAGSARVLTQPPPQSVPEGHAVAFVQWPPMQSWVEALHAVPQAPQFSPSLPKLEQEPEHSVKPGRHWQAPLAQTWRSAQIIPQPPQASGLLPGGVVHSAGVFVVAAQASPAVHMHAPLVQASPGAHGLPQPPQLSGSVVTLTHGPPPLHCMVPDGQVHTLLLHDAPDAHAWPHDPQLAALEVGSTQAPGLPHMTWPEGQTQVLLEQLLPEGHTLPHAPQLLLSVVVLMHLPVQIIPVQVPVHWPATQLVVPQLLPQLPQFCASLVRSTQPTPGQSIRLAGHVH
jgi:hypothetical protein